jgi:hypothetical protein
MKYEWRVFRVLPFSNGLQDHGELERQLNTADQEGWEVFQVLSNLTVILRRERQ